MSNLLTIVLLGHMRNFPLYRFLFMYVINLCIFIRMSELSTSKLGVVRGVFNVVDNVPNLGVLILAVAGQAKALQSGCVVYNVHNSM